jgi:hypothetical protein
MANEFDMGAQLSGQMPPEVMPGPPQTPEQFQERKSQWSQVLDRINSDPNLQLMILRMGTRLMQPIAPGQTAGGHFASALEDSVDYLGGLREAKRARQMQERKMLLEERKGTADIEHSQAATAATRQTTEQKAQTFPDVMSENKAKLEKINFELAALRVANTPEMIAKRNTLEMEKLRLENLVKENLASMHGAHAEAYKAVKEAATGKGDKVTTHVGTDGTITTTTMIGGKPYVTQRAPAEETDPMRARLRASNEIKKVTPWFGKAPYEGTQEEAIARRTQELLTPRVVHFDPTGKQVTALPAEPTAKPSAATPPAKDNGWQKLYEKASPYDEIFSREEQRIGVPAGTLKRLAITESSLAPAAVNSKDGGGGSYGLMQINGVHLKTLRMTPEQISDPTTNVQVAADILKAALEKSGGDLSAAIDRYKGATSEQGKTSVATAKQFILGGGQAAAPASAAASTPTPGVTQLTRGSDGTIRADGKAVDQTSAGTSEQQPGLLMRTRNSVERAHDKMGDTLDAATETTAARRVKIIEAKQRAGIPLTEEDRQVLIAFKNWQGINPNYGRGK